jgi:hypothetical protein
LGSHSIGEFLLNSGNSFFSGSSGLGDPLLSLGVLEDLVLAWGDNLSNWLGISGGLLSVWVGNDGLVDLLVDIFAGLGFVGGEALVPLGEEGLVLGWVFLLDGVHVVGNMGTEDSFLMDLSVILGSRFIGIGGLTSLVGNDFDLGLGVTWESLGGVRNVDSSIASTLKGTEDSGTGGGSLDTDIHKSLEWSLFTFALDEEHFTIDLGVGLVLFSESNLLQESSGEEKTGGVASGVVGKSSGKTVLLELLRISSAENLISSHGGVDNLGDDLSASSSNNKSIFLGVVLVLSLASKSSSSVVVGLTLSSSLWLNLHSLGIGFVLNDLDECHYCFSVKSY